jgi:phosphate uptake regulator
MYVCRVGSAAREEIMDLYVVAKILEEVNAHISRQASLLDNAVKLVSIGYKQDFETENEQ